MRRTSTWRRRRLTLRTRLTLSYAGLVTASGTVLAAVVYLYMRLVPVSFEPILPEEGDDAVEIQLYLALMMSEFFRTMLVISLGALLLLSLLSAVIGWVVAGRMLAPLSAMSEASRRAAHGDLGQRLDLHGPHDEIRDLADTFDHMLASLEASFTAHRRFASNASHELRTPLATTQAMIDVTLADPEASVEQLRTMAERVRETNRANVETVDALLDLAQAQSGTLAHERVDLAGILRSVLADAAEEARCHQVSLPRPPRASAVVEGDPVLLRQAVSNLVRNAVRHNRPGGSVSTTISGAEPRASSPGQGGTVEVSVANTGPLVSEEDLETLCEPFVRGAGRGRTRGSGHGLGLAIVSAVAVAHSGKLSLAPRPGGGLVAALELPSAPCQEDE
ncbi:sensor histidine kinase [Actinomyces gaoshouyii]|uniref:histidine kinase n=1 Tax=Actinomyces gaoshouyii TaxID=1960083 RepID=A0A8H9LF22_9ACTO|nr:HAMP domain-containing sensor histidine kinase [Actinomyces gaoshouyii]ARD41074.1 two-component sensor histidine kinase [Actinomyces gaoshouyii]GGO94665.1 two-component sensor histidine kinase [Actinomyces gaoshouyii]